MPENEFSSRNHGRNEDASQNHKHLEEMTTDELTDALSDMWDSMDENSCDPAQMNAYLAELEKREPISQDFDANTSLAAFHEKHARLFEQMSPVQLPTAVRPVHHRRWRTPLVAAIVAVVIMLCSIMTAQAFGFDIFGAIARWTEETFHFNISSQSTESQQNIPNPSTDGEFATLQEALVAYGILESVVPQWYPAGLETVEINVSPRSTGLTIQASYESTEKTLSIFVRQYATVEDANVSIGTFEKDSADIIQYECGGVTHYIMTNNSVYTIAWTNNILVCSIIGDLSLDEIEEMINSIY